MADAVSERRRTTALREPLREVGPQELCDGFRSALVWLEANQEKANDLNVFPVPDGDTGSNMYLTLRAAIDEVQTVPQPLTVESVLAAVTHGALMGARGNSGVILSQILRGFAQGAGSVASLDAEGMARALEEAAHVAYKAVMKPTEGTILTVVRDASRAGRKSASSGDVRAVLSDAVREGHAAVERTTEQLAVLRDAGVVDAGGFGFAVILEGFARTVCDPDSAQRAPRGARRRAGESRVRLPFGVTPPVAEEPRRAAAAVPHEDFGYCTEFLIHDPSVDEDVLKTELSTHGTSALVVGDKALIRVHIHTADPNALIERAAMYGRLSALKVEDMSAQHHAIVANADAGPLKTVGVVAVASGPGFRQILKGLGADVVVDGGQGSNPSTQALVDAVTSAHAEHVVLLPNNENVILTAEQVNALVDSVVVDVVPTRNVPQGIAALLSFRGDQGVADNVAAMRGASTQVICVALTKAVRKSTVNGFSINKGDVLALVDEKIVHVGTDEGDALQTVLAGLDNPPELVTAYRGSKVTEKAATKVLETMRTQFPDITFELHNGGQEHYSYVLSVE